jgi:hypothetical protein
MHQRLLKRTRAEEEDRLNLRNPVSKKDVELSGMFCISIRNKSQSLPVRTEHGKRIKSRMKGDPFKACPIHMNQIEIEFPAFWLMKV